MLLTVGGPAMITRCVSASPNFTDAAADTVDIGMVMGFATVVLAIVVLFGGTYNGGIFTGTIGPTDDDEAVLLVVVIGSLALTTTLVGCWGCGGLASEMVPSEGRTVAGV